MSNSFFDVDFPNSIGGVMKSWPGHVLSVRLARSIHNSKFKSWREVLADHAGFSSIHGIGKRGLKDVTAMFAGVGITFEG